jgi:hypothetical protein
MNLRTQLKSTRMSKGEIIQEYFSRILQFKEQLEAIEDTIDEYELIMKTLDGLTRPWDEFIKLFVPERRNYTLTVFGKNVFKKKQE